MMTPTKKNSKWIHAGMLALVGVGTDLGAQLTQGTVNPTRAVIVGLVIGGLSRVFGAIIAAKVADEGDDA
jgi:hypothetical protein